MNHIWHGQWGKKAVDQSTAKRHFPALFSCILSLFFKLDISLCAIIE
jgi:hypothetical protein